MTADELVDLNEECLRLLRRLSFEASGCPGVTCPNSRMMFVLSQDAFAALDALSDAKAQFAEEQMKLKQLRPGCPSCGAVGFAVSVMGADRCQFCDGSYCGNPPNGGG